MNLLSTLSISRPLKILISLKTSDIFIFILTYRELHIVKDINRETDWIVIVLSTSIERRCDIFLSNEVAIDRQSILIKKLNQSAN